MREDLAAEWFHRSLAGMENLHSPDTPPAWTLAGYDAAEQWLMEMHVSYARRADGMLERDPLSLKGQVLLEVSLAIAEAVQRMRRQRRAFLRAASLSLLLKPTKEPTKGAG